MPKTSKAAPPSYSIEAAHVKVEPDARGLMPLADARALVAAETSVVRDNWRKLWFALLSLEDADEFLRAARRLRWEFPHVGGWDNSDVVIRYGAGALPWLDELLAIVGAVPEVPAQPYYFVGSSLLAIGAEAVGVVLRAKVEGDADPDGLGFLRAWLKRHGEPAWQALAQQAASANPQAVAAAAALLRSRSREAKRWLSGVAATSPSAPLDAAVILRVLDAAAAAPIGTRLPWPTFRASAGHFEYHAMRVIGVRAATGDDWGILIEVVQGDDCDPGARWPAVVQRYTYGSRVSAGGRYLLDAKRLEVRVVGDRMTAPVGSLLDEATQRALDLRPGQSITGDVSDGPAVLAIRAALALRRDALFAAPASAAKVLKVPRAEIVVVAEEFLHVDGAALGTGPRAKLPSEVVSYRSLADAIVARDAARFTPGEPNTDWRLHLGPHVVPSKADALE